MLELRREYFVGDKYNHFLSANKKHAKIIFLPKTTINDYLKLHSVNFKSAVDLKWLFDFL
jgi:hypothetical protein